LLTAKQAAKSLKKGCNSTLVIVKHDDDIDSDNITPVLAVTSDTSPSSATPTPTPDCQAIVQAEFAEVFAPLPAGLPPDMGIDHVIKTVSDSQPPYRKCYRMSVQEKAKSYKQIQELLAKGWIEPSNSPYGAPILFVQKRDGTKDVY
jgi:hypothetical protein